MSSEPTMIDRAARAIYYGKARNKRWELLQPEFQRQYEKQARAAIEAMKDPSLDILGAMFEAMFEDKWNASQAPMIGAGWDAGIDAALNKDAS